MLRIPLTECGFPSTVLGIPLTERGFPSTVLGIPLTECGVSSTVLGIPLTEYGISSTVLGIPLTEWGFPSTVLSVPSQDLAPGAGRVDRLTVGETGLADEGWWLIHCPVASANGAFWGEIQEQRLCFPSF